jgi:hypothetical protein
MPSEQTALAQGSRSILTVLGVLLIPLGIEILCIASFVVAYSLFEGKGWAWSVAVVLSAMGVVVNVISLVTSNMGAITDTLVGIAFNAIEKVSTPSQPLRALEIIKATWLRSFFPEPSNLSKCLR